MLKIAIGIHFSIIKLKKFEFEISSFIQKNIIGILFFNYFNLKKTI